ncbi:MAG: sugar ABC transporter substrate-binding protein, partial [Butyricicoccaceae bacterium]
EAAVEAAKAAGWTEIKCIEIAGVEGDSTNTARMEGYREGVNGAGGEFLDDEVQYANADPDKAVSAMEAIMGKYPEGVAIICANNDDMAAAAAQAAKTNSAYSKTIFLGFNGDKGGCQAILQGNLTMSVAQKNYDIGYYAVDTMVKILNGEEVEEFVDTGAEIITKDNAQAQIDKLEGYLK